MDPFTQGVLGAAFAQSFAENQKGQHWETGFWMIWGFLEKSLEHRTPPPLSLVAQLAPKRILGCPRLFFLLLKTIKIHTS